MNKQQWQERIRPSRMEKRYEFEDYEALSNFLNDAAILSEARGLYPDIGFGRTHASFTIHAEEGRGLSNQQREFAALLDSLQAGK
jgi:4a-hydroxytetrahydrobiopterin dehydratase